MSPRLVSTSTSPTSVRRAAKIASPTCEYYVDGLVRRCVRKVALISGQPRVNLRGLLPGRHVVAALRGAVSRHRRAPGAADDDGRRRRRGRHRVGGAQDGSRGRELRRTRGSCRPSRSRAGSKCWRRARTAWPSRVGDLWDRLDDPPERLRDVRTMATGSTTSYLRPGGCWPSSIKQFGPGRNGLMAGTAYGRRPDGRLGRQSRCRCCRCPRQKDTIAPPEGVDAIRRIVPHAEVMRLPGGHVGIVAGRTAAALWERTVEFLRSRGRSGARDMMDREFLSWRGHRVHVSGTRPRRAVAPGDRASVTTPTCGLPFMQGSRNRRVIRFDAPGTGQSSTPLLSRVRGVSWPICSRRVLDTST